MKALIHVVTDYDVFSGTTKAYRLRNGKTIRSPTTLVPLAYNHGGEELEDLKVLVIIPHYFIFFSDAHSEVGPFPVGASREEVEDWVVRATDKLPELYLDIMIESTRWRGGRRPDFLEEWREGIQVSVVQENYFWQIPNPKRDNPSAFGSTGEPIPGWLAFDGFWVHSYIEALRFLDRVEPKVSIFDSTGGILEGNPNKPYASLACDFYASISGSRCEYDRAEPRKRGWRLMNDGFGSNWGYRLEEPMVSPNQLVRQFIEDFIQGILSLSISPKSMREEYLSKLHHYQIRDVERGERELRRGWRSLLSGLALLGRASCAYNSVILPYLHLTIKRLEAILGEIEEFSESLDRKAVRGDYVKDIDVEVENNGSLVRVHYRLLPPVSLPISRALLRTARDKLLPLLGGKS